jgi:hypothetical protein
MITAREQLAAKPGEKRDRAVRASFVDVNEAYETWLRSECEVDETALTLKHWRMRESAFVFLRATFFRWAAEIENVLPELAAAQPVLSVGDAHVQNFGIWHDKEGRLVWGFNDFDDAAVAPYPIDLVRLAASAILSKRSTLGPSEVCDEIKNAYLDRITRPRPYVLNEKHWWLRQRVRASQSSTARFWREMDELPATEPPPAVAKDLAGLLPRDCDEIKFARRTAGGGSLGRPRFVAIAQWRRGRIVREAKALVASGWDWSHGRKPHIRYLEVANGPSRSPDPNLRVRNGFLFRRLSPESRKLEFGEGDNIKIDRLLLKAMGEELGSIHGADQSAAKGIVNHLRGLDSGWLESAADKAEKFVRSDFREWKKAKADLRCDGLKRDR